METLWFCWLWFHRTYDSDIWFSPGHKCFYDSAYDLDSDSIASENQPQRHSWKCGFVYIIIKDPGWWVVHANWVWIKWQLPGLPWCKNLWSFFCCFLTIIFLGSIVLTSHWLLCTHCFMSLVSSTGFYTEDEPSFLMISRPASLSLRFSVLKIKKKFI